MQKRGFVEKSQRKSTKYNKKNTYSIEKLFLIRKQSSYWISQYFHTLYCWQSLVGIKADMLAKE